MDNKQEEMEQGTEGEREGGRGSVVLIGLMTM